MESLTTAVTRGSSRADRREPPAALAGAEPLSVLVVDGESLIRWSLSETLRDHGTQVMTASDGKSAIDMVAAATRPFDVILLDCPLPEVSEWTLPHLLLEMSPASAIVVMTAFPTAQIEDEALRLGASAVLRKPFELDQVTALVDKLGERRSSSAGVGRPRPSSSPSAAIQCW